MKRMRIVVALAALTLVAGALGRGTKGVAGAGAPQAPQSQEPPAPRVVDLKTSDGTLLKASYFAAVKPGPGVVLYHQSNRTRKSWDDVAARLAAAGINALTVDSRGFGGSGGNWKEATQAGWPGDLEVAFQYLISQPGVDRDVIGAGGAGVLGVENSVETARRHSAQVKSLVLLSGETMRPQLEFLHQAWQPPALFVVSDLDEYPPIQEAMQMLYDSASNPGKRLIHYVAEQEAPWVWYEPFDMGKVPAAGGHGTDLFKPHPELPGIIVRWFEQTLLKTPGHAPADPIAAAPILTVVAFDGGIAQARQRLSEARQRDPQVQLWPEVCMTTVGEDFMREGDMKYAVEVFKLNLLAYPDSADIVENLAEAYLADGEEDLARQLAERSLAMLDSHKSPASSWTDTEQYRGEIRHGAERVLQKTGAPATAAALQPTASVFRDCEDCPEMVVIPAGKFTMGSSPAEKSWAAAHGASLGSVADEAPQHEVTLTSFALGRYDITRGDYATFVRETGYPFGDGCGRDSFKWDKQPNLNWQRPGFVQTDRDPVVCVSWHDAQAYVAWLNRKTKQGGSYRLPSESEWEYAARGGTTTPFWWGEDDSTATEHAWFKANSEGHTHSVGSRPANSFGLYDMVGNVWQWTEDCYAESYSGAPSDGRANEAGGNCMRVDRGGSWLYPAWLLRSATRERNPADFRDVIMGFRVAKTLRESAGF